MSSQVTRSQVKENGDGDSLTAPWFILNILVKRTKLWTSMVKACIFPKRLSKSGRIFKCINCDFFSCIWSNRYVNHVKPIFDGSYIIKWEDNQGLIYLA